MDTQSRVARLLLIGCLTVGGVLAQDDAIDKDLADKIAEVKLRRDDAKPELIADIASARTRAAMRGLVEAYGLMGSIYMRREIIRALAQFDGVKGAEQAAVEKIANTATESTVPELREAAIEALGKCDSLGKHFMRKIVDSKADDAVRESALRLHVERGDTGDASWYRQIWNPDRDRRKDEAGKLVALELDSIRELAFAGITAHLSDAELVEAIKKEFDPKIRRAALDALHDKKSARTAEMAQWLFERVDFPGPDRANAARILVDLRGPKAAVSFVKLAKKRDVTPEDLRRTMAQLLVEIDDPGTDKKLAKLIGKGKPHEKVFALLATIDNGDPKVLKKIRRGLTDKSLEVRQVTAQVLAARRDEESLPALRKLLGKKPDDMRVAIEAISDIVGRTGAWLDELRSFVHHADRNVRNAAVEQLGLAADIEVLTEAMQNDDWSTRLVAIKALEACRSKEAVPVLIARLQDESGRLAIQIGDALWSLTGQPFDADYGQWNQWWSDQGGEFEVISKSELEKVEKEREMRRLMQTTVTAAEFFGVQIHSDRIIFVIDTSGSMLESMWGRYVGKRGAARIDVAKQELSQCIENLVPNSLFNILAFSSGIGYWLKDGIATMGERTRQDALTFVERLGAAGATNLYDTLKVAFSDQEVDTIVLLSDGEPTSGEVIDPHRIRQDVQFWNRHRGVKIHTIAIGGNLEVLEWLAEDSGGRHVRIR